MLFRVPRADSIKRETSALGPVVGPTSAIYSIKTPMACHVMINADTLTAPWKKEPLGIGGRDIKGGSPCAPHHTVVLLDKRN